MASSAQLIAQKLLHPSGDVRARTLQNLEFKLKHGLLTEQDVLEETSLTQSLLRLISLGDGPSITALALLQCQQLASKSKQLATLLLQQGALQQAQQLLQDGPPELQPIVNQLLQQLESPGRPAAAAAVPPAAPGTVPATGAAAAGGTGQPAPGAASSSTSYQAGTPAASRPPQDAAGLGPAAAAPHSDERLLRAQARADWRRQMDPTGPSATAGSWLRLPRVPLTAADDQYLFELNVRLQYSDDEALLLPALEELASTAAADFPAEALLQRQSLLDNVLALLGSSRMSAQVHEAAATALQQLLHGLRRSLALAADPALSDNAVAAAARSTAATAASPAAPSVGGGTLVVSQQAAGEWPAAAAVAGAATAITCPSSYPPLQLPAMSAQEAAWQLLPDPVEGCVDVGAVVWRILQQVVELLHAPERHWHLLPLVDLALPMALLPLQLGSGTREGSPAAAESLQHAAEQQAHRPGQQGPPCQQGQAEAQQQLLEQLLAGVHAQWQVLLASLSRALVATLAIARSERAAGVASAAGGGTLSDAALAAVAPGTGVLLAAVSADHGLDGLGSGEELGTAAWDMPSVNLLRVALLCLTPAPVGWLAADAVPRVVADALLAAALDGAVVQQVPGLRQAAVGVLPALRPHGVLLLEWADGVQQALQKAQDCVYQLPELLAQLQSAPADDFLLAGVQNISAAASWLELLVQALPGLGYSRPADAQLLRAAVHGLATCAAAAVAAGEAGAGLLQSCAEVALAVLTHSSSHVQHGAYGLLAAALDTTGMGGASGSSSSSAAHPAVQQRIAAAASLVGHPAVLECLVVLGLGTQSTRAAAAELLQSWLQWALQQQQQDTEAGPVAAALQPWAGWLSCYAQDAAAGPLAQAWLVAVQQQVEGEQPGSWAEAAIHVRQLFSPRSTARHAAARQLLQILGLPPDTQVSPTASPRSGSKLGGSSDMQDPFRGLLDPRSHMLDPLTDVEPLMAASFTPGDVQRLLQVLLHGGLAPELRRSAAEELLPLLVLPELREVLETEEVLEQLLAQALLNWPDENTVPSSNIAADDAYLAAASIFDMQLPVAVLQLLAGLVARSSTVCTWLQQHGDRLLLPLLGMAFHPLHSVRRATARLLVLVTLGWDLLQCSSYQAATGGVLLPLGATSLVLPAPFLQQYKWPFKVMPAEGLGAWVAALVGELQQYSVVPLSVQLLDQQDQQQQQEAREGWGFPEDMGQQEAAVGWRPLQVLRQALHNMMAQQRLLEGARAAAADADSSAPGRAPAGVLDMSDVSQVLLAATSANAAALDHQGTAAAALARVTGAGNHRDCRAGLQVLLQLSSTAQGVQAIADGPWQQALQRLLAAAPVTEDDQQLWLQVLQLLQRVLLGCRLDQECYVLLQQWLACSALPWLQQPSAADQLVRVPLALARMPGAGPAQNLAAAAELAQDTGGMAATWAQQLLRLRVSRAALSVLLVLVGCSSQLCDNRTAAAALTALHPEQLLPLTSQQLLKQTDGVDYHCRVLAARLLQAVVSALQSAATATAPGLSPTMHGHEEVLLACFEPVITSVVMPVAAKQAQGFRGKGLVRGGLGLLLVLTAGPILAPDVWSLAWGAVGGTFWMSRLSRDKESSIRCAAVQLLQRCLTPGAASTTTMLLHGWPDALLRLVRVATDASEAWGVRAAALRFLVAAAGVPQELCQQATAAAAAATGASADDAGQGPPAAGAGQQHAGTEEEARGAPQLLRLPRFGLAGVLQQQQLWDILPSLIAAAAGGGTVTSMLSGTQQQQQQPTEQPPLEIAAAAASLCLVALLGDPDGLGSQLLSSSHVVSSLLQLVHAGQAADAVVLKQTEPQQLWLGRLSGQQQAVAGALKWRQQDGQLSNYWQQLVVLQLGSKPDQSCGLEPLPLLGATLMHSVTASPSATTVMLPAALVQQLQQQHITDRTLAAAAALQVLSLPAASPSAGGDLALPSALSQHLGQLPGLIGQALCSWAQQLHNLQAAWSAAPLAGEQQSGQPAGARVVGSSLSWWWTAAKAQHWQVLLDSVLQAAAGLSALLEPLEVQERQQTLQALHAACQGASSTNQAGEPEQPLGLLAAAVVGLQQLERQAGIAAAGASSAAAECVEDDAAQSLGLPEVVTTGCLTLCELLSCLLVDGSCAELLLSSSGEEGAEVCMPGSSTPVGAALCSLLLKLLPASALDVSASGDATQWQAVGDLLKQPLPATALLTLRSLLCYSHAAKSAALQLGLHQQLLASCRLLGQVVVAEGVIPNPEQRVLMDATNTTAPAAEQTAQGKSVGPLGFQRPGSGVRRRAEVLTLNGPPPGTAPAAHAGTGVRSSGGVRQAGPQQKVQQQQQPRTRLRWASRTSQSGSSSGSPARTRNPAATAGAGPGRPPSAMRQSVDSIAAQRASTPAATGAGAGSGPVRGQAEAARKGAHALALQEAEGQLLLCLLMLRHLLYRDAGVKDQLVADGLVEVLMGVWPAVIPRPALLQELLQLVSSMVHGCPAFREAISQRRAATPKLKSSSNAEASRPPSLLSLMVAVVLDPAAELGLFSAVTRVLLGYSSSTEGGGVLARRERFVAAVSKLLSGLLVRKEWSRACHMMQVLATVSAHPEGQAVLLDATTAPAVLDLAVQALQCPHAGASTAALLLLRNLCLHPAARGPVCGHPQLLGLLLCATECLLPAPSASSASSSQTAVASTSSGSSAAGSSRPAQPPTWVKYGKADIAGSAGGSRFSRAAGAASSSQRAGQGTAEGGLLASIEGNVCAAIYAVSALWALVYQGESLKAGVRRLPAVMQRLAQVEAHAAWLASGLAADAAADEVQLAAAAALERCQFAPASINSRPPGQWLQELQDACEAVRQLMAAG